MRKKLDLTKIRDNPAGRAGVKLHPRKKKNDSSDSCHSDDMNEAMKYNSEEEEEGDLTL